MTSETKHKCTPQAREYDHSAEAKGWRPEIVFGLAYDYVRPGESVLDIGIGTGLASVPFHKAGLRVLGMDASGDMLAACRDKGIAEDLRKHDLLEAPYPFPSDSVDHVICVGVLNHFADVRVVFTEASRLLRDGGTFSFTVLDRAEGASPSLALDNGGCRPGTPVTLYRLGMEDVTSLLGEDFVLLKSFEFIVSVGHGTSNPMSIKAYVARRSRRE